MQVAIISDIHGNLVALDAVLVALGNAHPDRIVCLGHVAATGPRWWAPDWDAP
jgi:predicted phosphodiesterase